VCEGIEFISARSNEEEEGKEKEGE